MNCPTSRQRRLKVIDECWECYEDLPVTLLQVVQQAPPGGVKDGVEARHGLLTPPEAHHLPVYAEELHDVREEVSLVLPARNGEEEDESLMLGNEVNLESDNIDEKTERNRLSQPDTPASLGFFPLVLGSLSRASR